MFPSRPLEPTSLRFSFLSFGKGHRITQDCELKDAHRIEIRQVIDLWPKQLVFPATVAVRSVIVPHLAAGYAAPAADQKEIAPYSAPLNVQTIP